MHLVADVAPEAPTVKGFVSVLCETFEQAAAVDALAIETNLVERLGLLPALGMQRMRGLHAILYSVRRQIQTALQAGDKA